MSPEPGKSNEAGYSKDAGQIAYALEGKWHDYDTDEENNVPTKKPRLEDNTLQVF